jgi:hypothetical protein
MSPHSIREIRTRLDRLTSHVPTPTAPLVPVIPPGDGLPLPRGTRCATSEESLRTVVRLLNGEPSPYLLTREQREELDARFERAGGMARVAQMQRNATMNEGKEDNGHRPSNTR